MQLLSRAGSQNFAFKFAVVSLITGVGDEQIVATELRSVVQPENTFK